MAITLPHSGSWSVGGYRLPDFGVTEGIQGLYNVVSKPVQTTNQGGSNLSSIFRAEPQYNQEVQGISTSDPYGGQNMSYQNMSPAKSTSVSTPPSVGTSGSKNGSVPNNPPASTNYTPQEPDLGVFNDLIAPAVQALEGGIGVAQSNYDAAISNINAQNQNQVGKQEANTQSQYNQLNQRQTTAENATSNAIADARRGYAELSQGLQSRWGGSTGTGQFSDQILASQTQRNIAGYTNQLSQSIQQLGDTRSQIKLVHDQALQDLESNKTAAIDDAKARLQDAIWNIRSKQGELQSRKAELVANAINNYRAEVDRANQLKAQFAQRLYEQGVSASQTIDRALATQQQKLASLQLIYGEKREPVGVFNPNNGITQMYNGVTYTPGGQMILANKKDTENPNQPTIPGGTDEIVY